MAEPKKLETTGRTHMPALTSARFLPALLVMTYHMHMAYGAMSMNPPEGVAAGFAEWCAEGEAFFRGQGQWFSNLLEVSISTIDFFFVLSGFILTYSYLGPDRQARVEWRSYVVNRFARIYPAYALGLVFSLPLFLIAMKEQSSAITVSNVWTGLLAIFLLQSWWVRSSRVWNPPSWSLSCELFFYVLFPFLLRGLNRCSRSVLIAGLVVCYLASAIPSGLYEVLDPDGLGERVTWASEGLWLDSIKTNPLSRFPEFVFGMLLGMLFGTRREQSAELEHRWGAWVSCGATAALFGFASITSWFPYLMMHNGLLTPLYGAFIYGLALGGGPINAILSHRWLERCGDATYALYITHVSLIFYMMAPPATSAERELSAVGHWILCLVINVLLSLAIFSWVEVPARRWIRRKSDAWVRRGAVKPAVA